MTELERGRFPEEHGWKLREGRKCCKDEMISNIIILNACEIPNKIITCMQARTHARTQLSY